MSNQTRGGRINRINPLIQKIISEALLRNSDPLLNKATVTHVSTSPDLKKSLVFVSTLDGNEGSLKTSLEKNRNKIQKVIGKTFWIKKEPRKHRYIYILDKSKKSRILKSLKYPSLPYPKQSELFEEEIKKLEPIERT